MDGLHLLSLSLIEQKNEPKAFLNLVSQCDWFAPKCLVSCRTCIYPTTTPTNTTTIPTHNILSTPLLLTPDAFVCAPKHSNALLEFSSVEFDNAVDKQLKTEFSPPLVTLQYW
jgi:hypothetical protein